MVLICGDFFSPQSLTLKIESSLQSDSCRFAVWGSFPYLKGIFMSVTCSACTLFTDVCLLL